MPPEAPMRTLNLTAMALLVAGGLNWLLIGLFEFDLVSAILGGPPAGPHTIACRVIYIAVGLAALYGLLLFKPLADEAERLPHERV
jgi:uncharacterized protein